MSEEGLPLWRSVTAAAAAAAAAATATATATATVTASNKEKLHQNINAPCQKKNNTALKRWRILANALQGSWNRTAGIGTVVEEEISVRRFTSFGLLRRRSLTASSWYEYFGSLDNELFTVEIRHIDRIFTANELIGFNNTGNVCVWPSEECLAYYLLKNRALCRNRRVLELGGGMSCLAGIVAAKYCNPSAVTLTDGNARSVDNVRRIVARNGMTEYVVCGLVQWARAAKLALARLNANGNRLKNRDAEADEGFDEETLGQEGLYEVILSADCIFFDEARIDLVETIFGWLSEDGVALVMAPRRGITFQKFAEAAVKRGFIARQTERYDSDVWSRHLELLRSTAEYCPDLHYPLLLELTKQKKTPPG